MDCSTPGTSVSTSSRSLLKFMFIKSVMLSNHLILCHPLLLLPSIFPSIRAFSNELALHIRWPKYWSFSTSPSNEYSGLISFKIDWFDLLAVQGTLKSLLQYHSSKTSVLQRSAFFVVQLSVAPFTAARHPSPSFIVSWSLLRPILIESTTSSSAALFSFSLFQHQCLFQ